MNVEGGALEFESVLNNDKLDKAIEESKRRIQGFSGSLEEAGDTMDEVTQEIVECIEVQKKVIEELEEGVQMLDAQLENLGPGQGQQDLIDQAERARQELHSEKEALVVLEKELENVASSAKGVDKAFQSVNLGNSFEESKKNIQKCFDQIDQMASIHGQALKQLESEYASLGEAAAKAFMSGKDEEYRLLTDKQNAIKGEIAVRQQLMREIELQADDLAEIERKLEDERRKTEEVAEAHVSFRTRLRQVREEMMALEQAGQSNSARYRELQEEAGRLNSSMQNVNKQTNVLAHSQSGFQGVISAISGVSGGFSALQGTMGLFTDKNEDVQRVMLKVQSLMAITIGLQQISTALHKNSAFQLVVVTKAKNLFAVATTRLAVALGISNVAAQALMATLTLGLSVAITAIIVLWDKFSSSQKKAAEEAKKFREIAVDSCYKTIGSVESLSQAWGKLVDDLQAKEKFIKDNADRFKELGVHVTTVADAEKILIDKKKDFVDAMIARAKALAASELAMEKYKEALKKQLELEKEPQKVTRYYSNGMYGGMGSYEIDNPKLDKLKKQHEQLVSEGDKFFQMEQDHITEANKLLEEAEITSIDKYAEGTVGAIQQAISQKKEALKQISDSGLYKVAMADIEKLEKDLEAITGPKKKSNSGTKKKDPFLETLEERKKQYTTFSKWLNSGDEILAKTAKKEFAALLKEGDNYLDYLIKQRDSLLEVANPSKKQTENLKKLNDAIAEETKKTVLESFNEDLQVQLSNARSIMEMLAIIEEKRKELSNDNTEVDNSKKEILDEAQKDVGKKAKEETDELLANYASYMQKKLLMEQQFTQDMILLDKRLKEAKTEEERKEVEAAIANRKKAYESLSKNYSGDENYDAMVQQYRNFEQKKSDISEDFEEKRRIAKEHGNEELIQKLNEAEQKALSNLALEELTKSTDWSSLFGNLDELTTKEINRLLNVIKSNEIALGVKFDPKDLEVIKDKLQEAQQVVDTRNPFKALIKNIKDFTQAADDAEKKKSLTKIFESTASSLDLVKGGFDSIVGGLNEMGLAGDEVTQQLLGDISQMVGSASELATGIATGNPLGVIQGAVGLLTSAMNVFNVHDRKAERQIQKHRKAVEALKDAYADLERAVQKALGNDYYKSQQQSIKNLQEQQKHLLAMKREEQGKKKTDNDKVKEYEKAYKEAGQQIEDILDEIAKSITQTSAKDLANDLADAIVEAFSKGEDAAESFEEVSRKVMQNAVKNALKLQFLEKPLENAIKNLQNNMGHWQGDTFVFDGLTASEQQQFKNQIASIGASFGEALKVYEDLFKDLTDEEFDTSLTGAVKGVSEETASLVAGQMNAIRINQIEALEVMRQQLIQLTQISKNTSFNYHLEKLTEIVDVLKGNQISDPLRSHGLS